MNKVMKVLFVFNHPAPYKVRTYNELAKKMDIFVIFERTKAKDRPDSFYNINEYNFPHLFLKKGYFGREQSNTGEVKQYIKEHYQEYDLIVMNGYSTLTEMRAIDFMKKHKIPFILQINGGIAKKENIFKRKLKTKYISAADKYLSTGFESDKYLLAYGAKQKDIYHYVYSTLEEKDVLIKPVDKESKMEFRKEHHLPQSHLFVSDSQFIERKNNVQLIRLFKKLPYHLLLIGEGKEKELYESIIKEEKIDNVILHPFVPKDELYVLLKNADYFITLSKFDIYGHTSLEALANGLPVVSSNKVVSSCQIIKDWKNGFLVDIHNEKQILEAMMNVSKIDNNNCTISAKEYTVENSARQIFQALEEIKK
ncbi:MAG: glycosyltransferase [Bacilli bacterium]|nr:glycosyltransferase [Bacilli bacterium]